MGGKWRPNPVRIEQWLAVAMSVVLLDAMTGRRLAQATARYRSWLQRNWQPREAALPPPMVSQLHEEARRIVQQAAERQEGTT